MREIIILRDARDATATLGQKLLVTAVEALGDPAVRSRLGDLGMEVFPHERQTPEALGEM